ncbi:MAG: DUF2807 domain-containing protein, partial [Bacteroidales bacterium]|nr:DUF2807 domain-containing protein [Bacteroidales bacterium]
QWGKEMEKWGKEMEKWGDKFDKSFNYQLLKNDDSQAHAITVEGSGNVTIRQSQDGFSQSRGDMGASDRYVVDGNVFFRGSSDYDVAMPQLDKIIIRGSGDVIGSGVIKGNTLDIVVLGSGDIRLDVDYDTINIKMIGSGDVTLKGQCKVLYADLTVSGDLRINDLNCDETYTNATGSGDVLVNKYGKVISYQYQREQRLGKQSRLLNPHWNGFEAGLNMLIDPFAANVYTGPHESMAIRPLRSWYFGFNLADIGIAFDRKKMVGVFTGIGLGWNNYSWKNYISMTVENNELVNTLLPDDRPVKNSKFGLLYVQVPLMIEVRPTRHLYIDFGVTGGIRVAAWSRIKYCDGENRKTYSNYLTNLFKCDASLRIGGDNLGFFVSYALVPTFVKGRDAAKAHPLMLGLSINL